MSYRIGLTVLVLFFLGASCRLEPLQPVEEISAPSSIGEEKKQEIEKKEPVNTELVITEELEKINLPAEVEQDIKKEGETKKEETDPDKKVITEDIKDTAEPEEDKVLKAINLDPKDTMITVLLVAPKAEYTGTDAYKSFGCQDVLVPVKVDLEKTQSNLAEALVQLLVIKKNQYSEQGLTNHVAGQRLTLTNIKYEDGVRAIELEGNPEYDDECQSKRVKAQIEETTRLYADNYVIRLNGGREDWLNL